MSYGQYSRDRQENGAPIKPATPKRTEKKRIKHVFDTKEVPHVWAHPKEKDGSGYEQTDARNPQGNLYFKTLHSKRVLYSYRDTYPIGSIFTVGKKPKPVVFLLKFPAYSVTTSGHMWAARQATSHYDLVFTVARPDCFYESDHKSNVADYIERLNKVLQKYTKARSSENITGNHQAAIELLAEVKKYARVFGVRLPKLPAVPKLDEKKLAQIKERERIRNEKMMERARIQSEAWEARHKAESEAWVASGFCKHTPAHSFPYKHQCELQTEQDEWEANKESLIAEWRKGLIPTSRLKLKYGEFAILRLNIEDSKFVVETSQGVKVPVSGPLGAARLLRVLRAFKAAGRTYQTNGHSEHIGRFTVKSFGPPQSVLEARGGIIPEPEHDVAQWVLVVGCHHIVWEEIERIAPEVLKAERDENTTAYA